MHQATVQAQYVLLGIALTSGSAPEQDASRSKGCIPRPRIHRVSRQQPVTDIIASENRVNDHRYHPVIKSCA